MNEWDEAYANAAYIPGGADYPAAWAARAAAFRARTPPETLRYGKSARQQLDLFLPAQPPAGLMIFVHGGYWLDFDKSSWSHLAAGAVARGWAAAIPSYTLASDARIGEIGAEIIAAIAAVAERVAGPITLSGHSAGGQLAARAAARGLARVVSLVSISGLHDLHPLMQTSMNATLRLDDAECLAESPALLPAPGGVRATAWVGAEERPEFRRQTRLLADAWGAALVEEPGRHHFDVIDGLADPAHPMMDALLG